jgi:hypothetical protein
MRLGFRYSHPDDVEAVSSNLRESDLTEFQLIHGKDVDPQAVILEGASIGPSFTLLKDKDPIAVFGCVDIEETHMGVIWLVGTPEIEKVSIEFLRVSKPVLEQMTAHCSQVFNFVWSGNTVHLRWLRWLGFDVQSHFDGLPEAPREFLVARYIPSHV